MVCMYIQCGVVLLGTAVYAKLWKYRTQIFFAFSFYSGDKGISIFALKKNKHNLSWSQWEGERGKGGEREGEIERERGKEGGRERRRGREKVMTKQTKAGLKFPPPLRTISLPHLTHTQAAGLLFHHRLVRWGQPPWKIFNQSGDSRNQSGNSTRHAHCIVECS